MREFGRNGRFGRSAHLMGLAAAGLALAACANNNVADRVDGRRVAVATHAAARTAKSDTKNRKLARAHKHGAHAHGATKGAGYSAVGLASWYGAGFHGRRTADGETFDMNSLTAAHPTLPLPCRVRVTNLANRRSIVVRVNDRGPYVGHRLIDVSARTARVLGFYGRGLAKVKVDYIGRAD